MQDVGSLGRLNELEQENLEALKSELRGSIQKGVDFVASGKAGMPLPDAHATFHPSSSASLFLLGSLALSWQLDCMIIAVLTEATLLVFCNRRAFQWTLSCCFVACRKQMNPPIDLRLWEIAKTPAISGPQQSFYLNSMSEHLQCSNSVVHACLRSDIGLHWPTLTVVA